jgi:hypothetical protein
MYSSTLSLTLALDEFGWSTPRPSRFTPGKETRYPLYRRLGGPNGRSGRVRKIIAYGGNIKFRKHIIINRTTNLV